MRSDEGSAAMSLECSSVPEPTEGELQAWQLLAEEVESHEKSKQTTVRPLHHARCWRNDCCHALPGQMLLCFLETCGASGSRCFNFILIELHVLTLQAELALELELARERLATEDACRLQVCPSAALQMHRACCRVRKKPTSMSVSAWHILNMHSTDMLPQ